MPSLECATRMLNMRFYGEGVDYGFEWDDAPGEAVVRMPAGETVAGVVALHGARDGRARQPLFDQLGECLTPLGVAVLSYQRRAVDGGDIPLSVQAADAIAAARALTTRLQRPVGLFGFSQGAWVATLAAEASTAGFLVVLGCSGVTPAEQMRFYTDELLRRKGFGTVERAMNLELRLRLEESLRRATPDHAEQESLGLGLQAASREPWFPLSYLPPVPPPEEARWSDIDFDPVPGFAKVRTRVLAMWGEDEECVPREVSRERWRASGAAVTLVNLPYCGHWPVAGSGDPDYLGCDIAKSDTKVLLPTA